MGMENFSYGKATFFLLAVGATLTGTKYFIQSLGENSTDWTSVRGHIEHVYLSQRSAHGLKWDYLLFTQQWPNTTCIEHREKEHKTDVCNLDKNITTWTVHGIWPTKHGSRGPNFCNKTWEFDESLIADLQPDLMAVWPNMFSDTAKTSLWEHEWEKHGTCAAQLPELGSEHQYFSTGVHLARKHDLKALLASAGVRPHDTRTYTISDVLGALVKAYADPIVDCVYDEEKDRHLLSQIKICLSPALTVTPCHQHVGMGKRLRRYGRVFTSNCPREGIVYPATAN